ncbi:MAG TPA: prephenate dehydratase [Clostridiales bacterium]|nr:prephenate dehydratase [Clostridiales bacterium]
MNLQEIRKRIDQIDAQMVRLLTERLECSIQVAKIKKQTGQAIYHPEREQEIINYVKANAGDFGDAAAAIYLSILEASRELQYNEFERQNPLINLIDAVSDVNPKEVFKLACQGVEGAFSHSAALNRYPNAEYLFFDEFEEVFKAVESGTVERGLVPVENSSTGSVSEVYDLILKYRHYIVDAVDMSINQNLLACRGADLNTIKKVYSHPQAVKQCLEFIKDNSLEAVEAINTATAAKLVAEKNDPTIAAIGSAQAAKLYGLDIVRPCIQTIRNNSTRFIVISKTLSIPKDANKVSLVFSLPHVTGSLYRVLNRFALRGLNLTKIESRSAKRGGFEYLFYLDFAGNVNDIKVKKLLAALSEELEDFTFLGNYKEVSINCE